MPRRKTKTLENTILDTQKELVRAIKKLEKKIISRVSLLKTTKGDLSGIKSNLAIMTKVHKELIRLFETEYNSLVTQQIKDFDYVAEGVLQSLGDAGIVTKYTNFDIELIKALKKNTYNQFVQFGSNAQQQLARAMYDAVIAQEEFGSLVTTFQSIMTGHVDKLGRPMITYATMFASDSIMNFHRSVHLHKAEAEGVTHFKYAGTAMTTTRDFCRKRIGKTYSKKDIESWDFKWAGKSGPALTHCGGYRCRHRWIAMLID